MLALLRTFTMVPYSTRSGSGIPCPAPLEAMRHRAAIELTVRSARFLKREFMGLNSWSYQCKKKKCFGITRILGHAELTRDNDSVQRAIPYWPAPGKLLEGRSIE